MGYNLRQRSASKKACITHKLEVAKPPRKTHVRLRIKPKSRQARLVKPTTTLHPHLKPLQSHPAVLPLPSITAKDLKCDLQQDVVSTAFRNGRQEFLSRREIVVRMAAEAVEKCSSQLRGITSKPQVSKRISATRSFLGTLEARMLGVVFDASDGVETVVSSEGGSEIAGHVLEEQLEATPVITKRPRGETPENGVTDDPVAASKQVRAYVSKLSGVSDSGANVSMVSDVDMDLLPTSLPKHNHSATKPEVQRMVRRKRLGGTPYRGR